MKQIVRAVIVWIPIAVAVTGAMMFASIAEQQQYRQSLNDPQIQHAEDMARAITNGAKPENIMPASKVDIKTSLAPWVAVYTSEHAPYLSSGLLHDKPPQIPNGVFTAAASKEVADAGMQIGEDRVTWQPETGVRQAIVVVAYKSVNGEGFVVAGRNMREAEEREGKLMQLAFAAWVCTLAASLLGQMFARRIRQ